MPNGGADAIVTQQLDVFGAMPGQLYAAVGDFDVAQIGDGSGQTQTGVVDADDAIGGVGAARI